MALAMKYVDDVVIGAPYIITEDLIRSLNIKKVVHVISDEDQVKEEYRNIDPYAVPKEQGIYTELPKIENDLTLEQIALRVAQNRAAFQKKLVKKVASQNDYYRNKKVLSECSTPSSVKKSSPKSTNSGPDSITPFKEWLKDIQNTKGH